MPACHRPPVCVCHWVSTHPVHRRGSRCPARPVSSLSGVQPVHRPVIWLPHPDAAVRPAGVQPVRPVAAVSSCVSRVVAMGDSSVRRAAVTTGSSRVPCGPARAPAARSTARGGMDAGTTAEVVWRSAGECRPRTWAGWCFGGRLRPTDQAGQTAARGARRWRLRSGRGAGWRATLPHGTVGRPSGWSRDYSPWSLRSRMSEWTGPEGPNGLGGQDGARPQRGPAR
jgi:hypothetical protein